VTAPLHPLLVERLRQPVSATDRDAVIALESGSFANPWTAETFDMMLATPVSQVYVARTAPASDIIAFCACWVIEGDVHINTVAVHEAVRRQGVGAALLEAMLRGTSARRATLEVRRSNVAALALYRKLGFEVTAVRPKYYGNPEEDGLILWLNP
jgi:[ribosomal protein S18]-alanine N-acetyltransferase